MIDELAALAYVNERDLRRRIENALGLLLSQGRAGGVTVVGAIQDPRKDVLPDRDLFPVRVALRLTESEQIHLVLGPGAWDRGARCDQIPHSLPGVARPARTEVGQALCGVIGNQAGAGGYGHCTMAAHPNQRPRSTLYAPYASRTLWTVR
jgi:DNA segregation ATPase FtsK/SpoIIIE-like protein